MHPSGVQIPLQERTCGCQVWLQVMFLECPLPMTKQDDTMYYKGLDFHSMQDSSQS